MFDDHTPLFDQEREPTVRERAILWLRSHQALFVLFEHHASRMTRRFGLKALAERVRWDLPSVSEVDGNDYKINNSYVAYIGRRLGYLHPHLKRLIECRLTAAEQIKGDEPDWITDEDMNAVCAMWEYRLVENTERAT